MTETNRIEYKRELSEGLEREVVSFLNYRKGGTIYLGLDQSGESVGMMDVDQKQLIVKDRIKNNIRPSALGLFDIITERISDKNVIKITIASGLEKPYYLKKYGMSEKGCYLRLGSSAEPMSSKIIDELYAKRTRNTLSKIVAPRQDLKFSDLLIYYNELGYTLRHTMKKNLGLETEDAKLNYVGYLLSDKNHVTIKVAKYKGTNRVDLTENNEFGNQCLVKAVKQVIDKLNVENITINKITYKERIEYNLWHSIALREAVINAFVHNDYTNELTPKFEIFSDRIEITSAGSLPNGLSREGFFDGVSAPRNKELMRVFKDLELVEYLGSGIPRILEYYDKKCFVFLDHFLRIVFYKNNGDKEIASIEKGGVIDEKGGVIDEKGGVIDENIKLTVRQRDLLNHIQRNNRLTYIELSKMMGINQSAIGKHINFLKQKGFLVREKGTRGFWKVKKEVISNS
ncbi:MAG: putative DNA binding domain-containing protein [Flavobacteriaceae bacterium]|nr:putative DNA binding domain-containing protein [Flavobacteriaceae bacterium]